MRRITCYFLLLCLAPACGMTAVAGADVQVTFGKEVRRLQDFVNRRYGRGNINVKTDYIGARRGDIDPWFWVGDHISAVRVRMLKRGPDPDIVGWYLEGGAQPCMPEGDGVLFSGQARPHEETLVTLPGTRARFGFYVRSGETDDEAVGSSSQSAPTYGERFYSNRRLNDCGPQGQGAVHPPFDGDVQALIFDVSRWAGPDTWLVCFEDRDSGGIPDARSGRVGGAFGQPDEDDPDDDAHGPADNDFDDMVFEVKAEGATPAHGISFGALKLRYR